MLIHWLELLSCFQVIPTYGLRYHEPIIMENIGGSKIWRIWEKNGCLPKLGKSKWMLGVICGPQVLKHQIVFANFAHSPKVCLQFYPLYGNIPYWRATCTCCIHRQQWEEEVNNVRQQESLNKIVHVAIMYRHVTVAGQIRSLRTT